MPYKLFKVPGGYKVGKSDGKPMSNGKMYASNKPLSKERAEKQMKAMYANERGNFIHKKSYIIFRFDKNKYKVGKIDGTKFPNGRYYTKNGFLTLSEAEKELSKIEY